MVHTVAITLLRHGLTNENIEKKYLGWSDVPLCERGITELEYLKKFGFPEGDVFFVSDLQRCKQTFQILYGNREQTYFFTSFREMNFGQWELKTYEELQHDGQYRKWLDDFKTEQIPLGERFSDFKRRVLQGWQQATSSFFEKMNTEHIVIISHGGPIRLLLECYAPEERDFWNWPIKHGEGYTLVTTMERLRRNERCILLQEVPSKEKENGCINNII